MQSYRILVRSQVYLVSTALLVAVAFGSETVINLFLARENIDVNARNVHGETALWHAAYAGRMCYGSGRTQKGTAILFGVASTLSSLTHTILSCVWSYPPLT